MRDFVAHLLSPPSPPLPSPPLPSPELSWEIKLFNLSQGWADFFPNIKGVVSTPDNVLLQVNRPELNLLVSDQSSFLNMFASKQLNQGLLRSIYYPGHLLSFLVYSQSKNISVSELHSGACYFFVLHADKLQSTPNYSNLQGK